MPSREDGDEEALDDFRLPHHLLRYLGLDAPPGRFQCFEQLDIPVVGRLTEHRFAPRRIWIHLWIRRLAGDRNVFAIHSFGSGSGPPEVDVTWKSANVINLTGWISLGGSPSRWKPRHQSGWRAAAARRFEVCQRPQKQGRLKRKRASRVGLRRSGGPDIFRAEFSPRGRVRPNAGIRV